VRVRLLSPPGEPVLESGPEWKTGSDGRFTFQAAAGAVLEASRGALRGWAHVDRNVLINHRHSAAIRITIVAVTSFTFDPRLFRP